MKNISRRVYHNADKRRMRPWRYLLPFILVLLCGLLRYVNTGIDYGTPHISIEAIQPVLHVSAVAASVEKTQNGTNLHEMTGPYILIYHTHTTEAYAKTESCTYESSGSWRTEDQTKSVVAVGALLTEILTEEYGYEVIHDTTNHEPPKLSTAYSRSEMTMKAYLKQYPSIGMFIDIHRDAYGTDSDEVRDFITVNGVECARMMFVVGTGEGPSGNGFSEMPDFGSNYALANAITEELRKIDGRFMRDVRIKTGRYNQHVSNQCLLIEVGHTANTLDQALSSIPYLAAALDAVIQNGISDSDMPSEIAVWAPLS